MSMAGLSDQGYTAKRTSEYLTDIRDRYEAATGLVPDWDRDTVIGNLTAIMAALLNDLDELTQAVYDARDPNNATGVQLTNLALAVGISRQEATRSTATVTLTGTPGTIIVHGKKVGGGGASDDAEWSLTQDATIGGGGTVDVVVECTATGATVAGIGAIDAVVTPVAGWTSVTNAAAANVGQDRESDQDLRARRQASLQVSGASSIAALRANLLALVDSEGQAILTEAVVLENDTPTAVTTDGEAMAANSLKAIVRPGGLSSADQKTVARAIYDLKPIGIETNGTDVVIQVSGLDIETKAIHFDYATDVDVVTEVDITMKTQEPGKPPPRSFADALADIKAAITAHYDALGMGDDVERLAIATAVKTAVTDVRVATVRLGIGAAADQDVAIKVGERAIQNPLAVVTEVP